MTKFRRWLREYGEPTKLARDLGITRQSIYFWIWERKLPKAATIARITALSGGVITAKDFKKKKVVK